jgi:hypothetical protein
MAVQEYLPGSPKKRLVKLVRLILRKYGIAGCFEDMSPVSIEN